MTGVTSSSVKLNYVCSCANSDILGLIDSRVSFASCIFTASKSYWKFSIAHCSNSEGRWIAWNENSTATGRNLCSLAVREEIIISHPRIREPSPPTASYVADAHLLSELESSGLLNANAVEIHAEDGEDCPVSRWAPCLCEWIIPAFVSAASSSSSGEDPDSPCNRSEVLDYLYGCF